MCYKVFFYRYTHNYLLTLQMKGQKRTIVAVLIGALYDEKLVLESLRLLALIFPRLKGKDVGFLFKDISLKTTSYLADVSKGYNSCLGTAETAKTYTQYFTRYGPKEVVCSVLTNNRLKR